LLDTRGIKDTVPLEELSATSMERDADIIVTLDADGQHEPKEIPNILQPIIEHEADIVTGSRFLDKKYKNEMPRYRAFGVRVIIKFIRSKYCDISDAQSGFRAISKMSYPKSV
jgi:glycosyltransferase involved in cell wall biosynthesis